ncbi:MAG TPA: PQQ-binding-like beta-propeller repeat protein [Candidatus Acidoferrales bacterium]|nr:PQQ-binding-like beta-propeller repeat protein [Candidatus Acidoferrales bacterium]
MLQLRAARVIGSRRISSAVLMAGIGLWVAYPAIGQDSPADGNGAEPRQFGLLCAGCHGIGGAGGDRAPALVNNRGLRNRSENQIHDLIRDGTPGGMPNFALPEADLRALAQWAHSLNIPAADMQLPGDAAAGEQFFFGKGQCASCHIVAGRGKANGPDLSDIGRQLTAKELGQALDDPGALGGMHSSSTCPSWAWCPQNPWAVVNVRLQNGTALRGFARNQGMHDLQLQTLDGQMHLLHEGEYDQAQPEKVSAMPALKASADERRNLLAYLSHLEGVSVGPLTSHPEAVSAESMQQILNPKPGDWATYNGNLRGNRYSAIDKINLQNVDKLQLQWTYSLSYTGLQTTPLVVDGVMYVTAPNQACALDARSGRELWCHAHPRDPGRGGGAPGGAGAAAGGRGGAGAAGGGRGGAPGGIAGGGATGPVNRGAAILGDRVFLTTDSAHLLCLNRLTGGVMWDVTMPETPGRYGGPAAPLVVGDLVVAGVSGGDGPLRGFLAAYHATTGQLAWRFWTIPKRGEPASETWIGTGLETGGGATWLTGSYDPDLGLLYWPTGNPYPPTDGDQRGGDNLYTAAVVALDAKTGKLRWHFQFSPHDLHDWDASEPLVLVDAPFHGKERKLLLQANRNGFFYVLDRTTGEFLLGKPFVKRLTWATGIGPDGRPQLVASLNKPTPGGTKACPAVRGATNWYSTAYNPGARLFYVMAVEDCNIYRQGRGAYTPFADPANPPEKYLRAIDIETGKIVWEVRQVGVPEANYSGVLSTAGNLVFYGQTGGSFAAADARTGRTRWYFETGQSWRASPITYMVNGRQYVAIASGNQILSFALPEK